MDWPAGIKHLELNSYESPSKNNTLKASDFVEYINVWRGGIRITQLKLRKSQVLLHHSNTDWEDVYSMMKLLTLMS